MEFKKITLIIPFYNENKKITFSTKQILRQAVPPDEIIFLNDKSSDNSELKLRLYLKNYNNIKLKIRIISLKKRRYPSEVKNIGIKNSNYENVAFFDVGLSVNRYFIHNLKQLISPRSKQYIQGNFYFKSENYLDRSYLMQTYGLNKFGKCIPSSCFKKNFFKKFGYFENYRSGYDRVFLEKLESKEISFISNLKSPVNYVANISGTNLTKIFDKIFFYSFSTIGLKGYFLDKIYILIFIIFLIFLTFGFTVEIIFLYLFLRCFVMPIKKNLNLSFKKLKITDFIMTPVIGILIDVARVSGFLFGYLKKLIK